MTDNYQRRVSLGSIVGRMCKWVRVVEVVVVTVRATSVAVVVERMRVMERDQVVDNTFLQQEKC